MQKTQKIILKDTIFDFCNNIKDSKTFSLAEINDYYKNYNDLNIGGKTPQATIHRLLQELRDDSFISFNNNSGSYTLKEMDFLNSEKEDLKNIVITN